MNIEGAILFISILAIIGYAMWLGHLSDRAAFNRRELAEQESTLKDKRAQVAALSMFIASMERDIPVLKNAITRLDQEYVQAIHRNAAISDAYSVAASAWNESEA